MELLIKWFTKEIKMTRKVERLRSYLCRKAAKIYVPNGLMDQIPEEWGCEWEELITVPSGDKNKPLFGENGYLTGNLNKDKARFDKLFYEAMKIQDIVNNKTDIDFSKCETIRSDSVQNHCPLWDQWTEWSECPECRRKRGSFKVRTRDCTGMSNPIVGKSMPYTALDCEEEYGEPKTEIEPCNIDDCR